VVGREIPIRDARLNRDTHSLYEIACDSRFDYRLAVASADASDG
jgi:hypothetical protein